VKYLVASVGGDGVPHVVITTPFATHTEAWAAVFAFDTIARDFWVDYTKGWPEGEDRTPFSDTVVSGSILQWTLVKAPS